MKTKSLILSTGLAIFSMFFGSGNLVFPIIVGQSAQGHFGLASLGILLTGVFVPLLGIFALFLFKGDSKQFFEKLGKPAIFWFPLIALSLMGPFGVLARCITVAHGAFKLMLPATPLWTFSLVSCAIIFLLTIRKSKIVPILGTVLTPILLASLTLIAIFGVTSVPFPTNFDTGAWHSFKEGIFQGYQTMDLLAAFFFSGFVIKHLQDQTQSEPGASLSIFLKASLLGAGILSAIYCVLILLGAMYSPELAGVPPVEMLGFIAERTLGSWAAPLVASAVILACLTTAIVLTSLFADFLKREVSKEKIGNTTALGTTLAIAFAVSTLEFSGIAKILGPILEVTYPALITLTVASIFHKLWGWRAVKLPFAAALLLKMIGSI